MQKNSVNDKTHDIEYKSRTMGQEVWRMFRKNKTAMYGLAIIVILILLALSTIVIDSATQGQAYNDLVIKQNLRNKLKAPSFNGTDSIFGFDEFGRSIFFRMIWGVRYSLFIGLFSACFACIAGGFLGSLAGYYGGKIDNFIMRVMDIFLAIPATLMAIAIVSALGTSLVNLIISVSVPNIPRFSRIVRASIMTVKDKEFIEAAKAVGGEDSRIIFKYILPNAMGPVIVQFTFSIASIILSIAGLSYLGLGIQPPMPEWGAMLSSARNYIRDAWHITIIPGLGIMFTILAINLFGDGLRDALDPKMKN